MSIYQITLDTHLAVPGVEAPAGLGPDDRLVGDAPLLVLLLKIRGQCFVNIFQTGTRLTKKCSR